ncbi:MAG: hypothetical protein QXO71_11240 [Candidatus Jordarchaeaceae archaeon]
MVEIRFSSGEVAKVKVKDLEILGFGTSRVYRWYCKEHNKNYVLRVSYDDTEVLRRMTDIRKRLSNYGGIPESISYRGLPVGSGWGTKE